MRFSNTAGKDPNDPLADDEVVVEEDEMLPDFRPTWLSLGAWEKLKGQFNVPGAEYDPAWLRAHAKPAGYQEAWDAWYVEVEGERKAYARAMRESLRKSFESAPQGGELGAAEAAAGSGGLELEPEYEFKHAPPPIPAYYQTLNDFVVWNQVCGRRRVEGAFWGV